MSVKSAWRLGLPYLSAECLAFFLPAVLSFSDLADRSGIVLRVIYGDTSGVAGVRVRLHGIDAPERRIPKARPRLHT